ncbi:unnamed protein product [Arabis nemorensis]|uniref:Uncharacterized protein n=1 Tax=Arabis nemorensis TaxID=586526 RepID=A0A565B7A0_9BRAS|nr:unnamed protein product [Arabis nemorensis]
MEKISDSFPGFCLKATLCGAGGYVLGGLATRSIEEDDLEAEQTVIELLEYSDENQRTVEKLEKVANSVNL